MKKLNYLDELIPEYKQLLSLVGNSLYEIESITNYTFNELFLKHERGFFERNQQIFNKVGYNTKQKEQDKKYNEIKGLYIFYENENPIYVGISRKLIRRLRNHFLGKSHFEASLVYLIARDQYDSTKGIYMKTRKEFPLEDYRDDIQKRMMNTWKIGIYPETNSYKLYLLKIAVACKLGTKWNSFETH